MFQHTQRDDYVIFEKIPKQIQNITDLKSHAFYVDPRTRKKDDYYQLWRNPTTNNYAVFRIDEKKKQVKHRKKMDVKDWLVLQKYDSDRNIYQLTSLNPTHVGGVPLFRLTIDAFIMMTKDNYVFTKQDGYWFYDNLYGKLIQYIMKYMKKNELTCNVDVRYNRKILELYQNLGVN